MITPRHMNTPLEWAFNDWWIGGLGLLIPLLATVLIVVEYLVTNTYHIIYWYCMLWYN